MLRKEYLYQYNKKWAKENPDYYRSYAKEYARKKRREAIDHYGAVCVCCGESHYEFLCIDHINGGGNKHRKEIGEGNNLPRWLIKNKFPSNFQILCANCNQAKGANGICPHKI